MKKQQRKEQEMVNKKVTTTKRVINQALLKKYESYMETRDEYLDLDIRGEKPRKIAEWAEVVKWYSNNKADEALCIPHAEFVKMMGSSKFAIQYVRSYMKKFGIPHIRILVSADKVRMWSRTAVKE